MLGEMWVVCVTFFHPKPSLFLTNQRADTHLLSGQASPWVLACSLALLRGCLEPLRSSI